MSDNFDPIWRGTKEVLERPDSPKMKASTQGWSATRVFDGPYEALLKQAPSIGSNMQGFGAMEVSEVEIVPAGGGMAVMTISLAVDSPQYDKAADPVYEVEWVEVQKDIARHPRYQSGGDDELSEEEFACLKKARANDQDSIEKIRDAQQDPSLQKIWAKIVSGQDDYVEFIPVVTETITYRQKPADADQGAGFIDVPPGAAGPPPNYQWLLTGAPLIRTGNKWQRKRQWTGAWWIDEELYTRKGGG